MAAIFRNWRTSVLGLLSWAIPFFGSFPFFDPDQGLLIPLILFKSIMVVLGTLVGVALLVWLFRTLKPSLFSGLVVGLYWLAINWALDVLVLVPMTGSDIGTWFTEIGLRYLSIPIIAIGMGLIADRVRNTK